MGRKSASRRRQQGKPSSLSGASRSAETAAQAERIDEWAEEPVRAARRRAVRWLLRRVGRAWTYVIVGAVVLAGLCWYQRRFISGVLGGASAREVVAVLGPVERFDQQRFGVAVLRLENDPKDDAQQLIARGLRFSSGVQVRTVARSMKINSADPQRSVEEGHAQARKVLSEYGAAIAIWGSVLRRGEKEALELFVTAAENPLAQTEGHYQFTDRLEIPGELWKDVGFVLMCTIASRAFELELLHDRGSLMPVAELRSFAERLAALTSDRSFDARFNARIRRLYQHLLAIVLGQLGESSNDVEPLAKAVSIYRALLSEVSGDRKFSGLLLHDLGTALVRLASLYAPAALPGGGERHERGLAYLKLAADAFRDALKARSEEAGSPDWARTQTDLGGALVKLANREAPEKGVEYLKEAVDAYDAALAAHARASRSIEWANVRGALGLALEGLAEREPPERRRGRLEEAAAALRDAAKTLPRGEPWAMAQRNLCIVLTSLAEREPHDAAVGHLTEAVNAGQKALEVPVGCCASCSRVRSQLALGDALRRLAERERGGPATAHFDQAIAAFRDALKVAELAEAKDLLEVRGSVEQALQCIEKRRRGQSCPDEPWHSPGRPRGAIAIMQ